MATPFYGTISILGNDGLLQVDRFDSDDVTAHFCTFKSNGGLAFLTIQKTGVIKDIVLNIAAAGTTKDFKMYINQKDTNIRWVQSANFPALATHFPNTTPIPVVAGQQLMIETIT